MVSLSESLGSASLELEADLVPFDHDLDKAEKRAAAFVAATQAMFDRLHIGVRDDGSLGARLSQLGSGAATMAGEWKAATDSVRASLGKVDTAIARTAAETVAASEIEKAAIDSVTRAYLEQAAAARAAAGAGAAGGSGLLGVVGARGGRERGASGLSAAEMAALAASGIEGVRGKGHVGSRTNPQVVVIAAGSREPLGSYAAAVAEQAASGAVTPGVVPAGSGPSRGVGAATGASRGTSAVEAAAVVDLSRKALDIRARALGVERPEQFGSKAALIAAMPDREPSRKDLAAALTAAELMGTRGFRGKNALNTGGFSHSAMNAPLFSSEASRQKTLRELGLAGSEGQKKTTPAEDAVVAAAAARALQDASSRPYGAGIVGVPGISPRTNSQLAQQALGPDITALSAALFADAAATNAKSRMPGQFAPTAPADIAALEALGMSVARSPSGANRVYGIGGVPGTHNYGASPYAAAAGGAAGGGGGGLLGLLGLGGGGGRGGGNGSRLLYGGGGLLGLAGFGSAASFAGFGAEHLALTAGGIAGSGVAALGGGALLGAGTLGKIGVGGGSDLAVLKSTVTDTGNLYKAYEAVVRAVRVYGKNSEQAQVATAELNATMLELGNTAGVKAEEGVAKAAKALNEYWDKATSGARIQASKLLMQGVELGHAYVKPVAKAAEENLPLVNKGLKPLFAWLKGPEGMGIFLQLESEFKNEIPTAMKAFDQGVEFFAKTIAYTAPLTGAFLKKLDDFFTKYNQPGNFAVWEGEMNKLITDFHVWGAFIKELGGALVDLFKNDAHTGEGIIETLTAMLHKVREYEKSTAGAAAIHNVFVVHKEEAIALLDALAPLIGAFSHIYTTVAPPLVHAVTMIAEAFTKVLSTIEKAGPLGTWAIGLTLIAAKLKLLTPLLGALKTELFGVAAAEGDAAAGATALAEGETAAAGAAAAEGAGAAGGAAGLASKSLLLKGGLTGFVGLMGGSALAGATGAKGTLGTSISAAGAGAGAGFVLGPAAGALIGTEIAPVIGTAIGAAIGFGTPYLIKGIGDLFHSGEPAFQKEAHRTAAAVTRYAGLLGPGANPHEAVVSKALEAAHQAAAGGTRLVPAGRGAVSSVQIAGNPAAAAREYAKAGNAAAAAFVEAFQHVRFPTRLGFLTEMEQRLNQLPAAARTSAAKTMLVYAEKLEAEGRLPQGVVAGFVSALERKVTGLTAFLVKEGVASAHALQKGYELTAARSTLRNSLVNVEQLFGVSFKDTTTGVEHALGFLNEVVKNNKGPLGEAAQSMASALKNGLEVEWIAAKEVNSREISALNKQFNTELKALGAPEIKALIGPSAPGGGVSGTPFSGGHTPGEGALAPGHAQGALYQIGQPGAAGRDTLGLNIGGMPIRVGEGEQVAVFNRHQQPIVNDALAAAGYGGLPGLFDAVRTPNYMAAGGVVDQIVHAGLADVRKAGKAKIAGTHRAGGTGGGSLGGASFSGSWVQVMRGIAKEEGWNLADWEKIIAHESGGRVSAKNPTSTAFGLGQLLDENYAVYGGGPGSSGVEQIIAMARYIKAHWRNPTRGWESEERIGTYSLGGLLGFAGGGIVPPRVTAKYPQRSTPGKIPKGLRAHTFGKIPPVNTEWSGQAAWAALNGMMSPSGSLAALTETYGLEETADELALTKAPHAGAFVVTPNAIEKAAGITTPFIETGNVSLRSGQLSALNVTETGVLNDLTEAWNWSQQVLSAAQAGIAERNAAIAELKARIKANLDAIKKCREAIARQEKELSKIPTGKKATAADRAHAAKLKQDIANEHGQLRALEIENRQLGGSATSIGTGGNIEALTNEVTNLSNAKASTEGWVTEIGGASGKGGKRQEAENTIAKLAQQMVELGQTPERLKEALLESGAGPESALELSERNLAQAEEKLKISKQETLISNQALSVFGGSGDIGTGGKNAFAAAAAEGGLFLPYGGSFRDGGLVPVPGSAGMPVATVLHGGETITPAGETGAVHNHWNISTLHPSDPATLTAIGKAATRGQRLQGYRLSKRLVPGV